MSNTTPPNTGFEEEFEANQRGNQNPYIEEEQITQWPKEKCTKDKQRSIKHTHKNKDRVTHRGKSCVSRRVSSFCFLRYNRVVKGLRCIPSSTNQQPGNLSNQKSPFLAD